MSIDLYRRLTKLGVRLYTKENKLLWEAPRGVVTADLLSELKTHKDGLLEILNIGKADRGRGLPLSHQQERLWFLAQLGFGELYHVPKVVKVRGELDEEALQKAFDYLTARHESLRTSFATQNGTPVQVVHPSAALRVEKRDLSGLAEDRREAEARAFVREIINGSFDLERPPLIRAGLVRLGAGTHLLAMCMHHIISDGWSMAIITRELSAAYEAFARGDEPRMGPPAVQYADYAAWQRRVATEESLENELRYWKEKLEDFQPLDMPTDFRRPKEIGGRGGRLKWTLGGAEVERMREFCRGRRVTLYALLVAAVYLILKRYSRQDDICLGVPVANRNHWEVENVVGLFVNTLVVRLGAGAERGITVGELLAEVQGQIVEAQDHQHVPFEKVVEAVQPERDLSRNPIFQVLVNYVNTGSEELRLGAGEVSDEAYDYEVSKFDLTFDFTDRRDGGLEFSMSYSRDLFERETIERVGRHLLKVIEGFVGGAESPVEEIGLLTEEEQRQILYGWNDTRADFPPGELIHGLFERQAERTPDASAVEHKGRRLSYGELNESANRLAHLLRRRGVGPETRVAVCLERAPELISTLLAVLKAGGTYVPLDPAYPPQRLEFMLRDSQAQVVVTQESVRENLPDADASVLTLEAAAADLSLEPATNPERLTTERNLAYVIYTSGSTGQPKGVAIEHASAVTLMHWAREVFTPEDLSGCLAATSVCFDLSVFEIFVPLSWGGTVVLAANALELGEAARYSEVRLVNTVPSVMSELLLNQRLPASVGTVNLAGEPLTRDLVEEVYRQDGVRRVFDLYGPSEDTTYSTYAPRDAGGPVTIGRPVANTQAYVLDERYGVTPVGVAGELFLGGAGLARGYLGRPALTAERFVPDPFSREPGRRMYRTGDLVRWRADGSLEYMGRLDQQVKVRGFRIECGEVETVLRQLPGVRDASVKVWENGAGRQLVGYVAADEAAVGVGDLRRQLLGRLPEYMVPTVLMRLDKLPLTPSGKVDRRRLPEPDVSHARPDEGYAPPRDALEETLTSIWAEVLGLERVGIDDDFFELGGHSLLALRLVNRMNLALFPCSIRNLWDCPTIRTLVEHVRAQADGVQVLRFGGTFPLLPAQEDALTLENFDRPVLTYVEVSKDVDEAVFMQALEVWCKQDIFRLRLKEDGGGWRQFYQEEAADGQRPIRVVEAGVRITGEMVQIGWQLALEFDSRKGPPLQIVLFKRQDKLRYMLWVIDHMLVDHISLSLLITNFRVAYNSIKAGERVSFPKDFVVGQWAEHLSRLANDTKVVQEFDFWKRHFARPRRPELAAAPEVFGREELQECLSKEETARVLAYVSRHRLSFEEACLVNFLWAYKNCFSDEEVLMYMIWNGRVATSDGVDLTGGLGWFSLHYPALFHLDASAPRADFLQEALNRHRRYLDRREHYSALRYYNSEVREELGKVEDWSSSIAFNCWGDVAGDGTQEEKEVIRTSLPCGMCHEMIAKLKQEERGKRGRKQQDSPWLSIRFFVADEMIYVYSAFYSHKVERGKMELLMKEIKLALLGLSDGA